MRAELISLQGDGDSLSFSFKGEGAVEVQLGREFDDYTFSGADSVERISSDKVRLNFQNYGTHNVSIDSL